MTARPATTTWHDHGSRGMTARIRFMNRLGDPLPVLRQEANDEPGGASVTHRNVLSSGDRKAIRTP